MKRSQLLVAAITWIVFSTTVQAAPMPVRHIQHPMHRLMVVRSEAGNIIANGEWRARSFVPLEELV